MIPYGKYHSVQQLGFRCTDYYIWPSLETAHFLPAELSTGPAREGSVGHERQAVPQGDGDSLMGSHHLCSVQTMSRGQNQVYTTPQIPCVCCVCARSWLCCVWCMCSCVPVYVRVCMCMCVCAFCVCVCIWLVLYYIVQICNEPFEGSFGVLTFEGKCRPLNLWPRPIVHLAHPQQLHHAVHVCEWVTCNSL